MAQRDRPILQVEIKGKEKENDHNERFILMSSSSRNFFYHTHQAELGSICE